MRRILILVEGLTEEAFVKQMLKPFLWELNADIEPIVLKTKQEKSGPDFKGGLSNFSQFVRDAQRMIYNNGGALITTMLDYYRLPKDFPGMSTRPSGSPLARVKHVESALHHHFGSPSHFVPYLALHEFESLLFVDTEELTKTLSLGSRESSALRRVRDGFSSPEDINEQPGQSPSWRIKNITPDYRKRLHGTLVCQRIGLDRLRAECQHFNNWMQYLEHFVSYTSIS